MRKQTGVVLGAFLASAGIVAHAESVTENVSLGGRIFTDAYAPTAGFFDQSLQQVNASIWLQGSSRLGENSSAHFTLTGDEISTTSVVNGRTGFSMGLREGYVTYDRNGFFFQAGKLIIPWGKSDGINPTDLLTAKNYTFFNPDEEVRRIGAVSFQMSWTPQGGNSPWTFTLVKTPVFPQSQILLAPGQLPSTVTLSLTPKSPQVTILNSETAVKISYAGQGWDASVLAFRGWNHLPVLQVTQVNVSGSSPSVNLEQAFQPISVLGADGSVTFGKWILRGEAAYVWTENNDGQNPLLPPTHLDAVIGVERPIGDDFRIQGQFFARYFPRYLDPSQASGSTPVLAALNAQVAQTNALIHNYQESFRPSATLRVGYSEENAEMGAEIFILYNFVGSDVLFRPKLSYRWTDALKSTAGLDYYTGPSDRPLGVLRPYSALYTELKYSF